MTYEGNSSVEINKLRTRLKNVSKNTTEYRMSVAEAKALLLEIDVLLSPKQIERPEVEVTQNEAPIMSRILDGGTF